MAAPKTRTDTPVPVPQTLRGAHSVVRETRAALSGLRAEPDGRLDTGRRAGRFRIFVSREQSRRAILILHALVSEAVRRGMQVDAQDGRLPTERGVGIGLGQHVAIVEIRELMDSVALTEEDLVRWRRDHRFAVQFGQKEPTSKPVANGQLSLVLPKRWDRPTAGQGWQSTWRDGVRAPLEAKLDGVLRACALRAEADRLDLERRAEMQTARQREAQERRAAEAERARTQASLDRLMAEASAWRRADEIRTYLTALRERLPGLPPPERERLAKWCDWGEANVDRMDPLESTTLISGLAPDLATPMTGLDNG